MAGSSVQLAPDGSGKKLRTYDFGTPGHIQYVDYSQPHAFLGRYQTVIGPIASASSPHTNNSGTGFWWFVNPPSSGVLIDIECVLFSEQLASNGLAATSPRITLIRCDMTNYIGATALAISKAKTTDATPVGYACTSTPAISVNEFGKIQAALSIAAADPATNATAYTRPAYGPFGPSRRWCQRRTPPDKVRLLLIGNEGILVQQQDAGTAASSRPFHWTIQWAEYTLP